MDYGHLGTSEMTRICRQILGEGLNTLYRDALYDTRGFLVVDRAQALMKTCRAMELLRQEGTADIHDGEVEALRDCVASFIPGLEQDSPPSSALFRGYSFKHILNTPKAVPREEARLMRAATDALNGAYGGDVVSLDGKDSVLVGPSARVVLSCFECPKWERKSHCFIAGRMTSADADPLDFLKLMMDLELVPDMTSIPAGKYYARMETATA